MVQALGESGSIDTWVERINERDLAAMTATVSRVQAVVGDEKSTVQNLTAVLEADAALSSKILRIANSPTYMSAPDPVTTISRAATLMGFDTIRNVCITNRLLESLLSNKSMPATVVERLMNRTASSLHAAIQARVLMRGASSGVCEEVFLAALFEQIGESAFWSLGGPEVERLDLMLRREDGEHQQHIKRTLGGSFMDLSNALVKSWGLGGGGSFSAFPNPTGVSPGEAVRLANEIADCVAREGWLSLRLENMFPRIADLCGITADAAEQRVRNAGREAQDMAHSYGFAQLARHMSYRPPLESAQPTPSRRFRAAPEADNAGKPAAAQSPGMALQSAVLGEMKAMLSGKADINTLIRTAMDGVHRGIGMDRTVAALLSEDRRQLRTRFFLGEDGERWSKQFRFDVPFTKSLMRDCINDNLTHRYNAKAPGTVAKLLPVEMMRFCGGKDFVIAPIVIGTRSIGVIYADRFLSDRPIQQEDFDAFANFARQLGNCLAIATQRRA